MTKSERVAGSGTLLLVPGTSLPAVVPNENVALLTTELAVTPGTFNVNEALWPRNGL